MSRKIPETDWLPPGADLFPDTATLAWPLLTCRDCGADIDPHTLFVRDGVCADCEWGES